MAILKYLDLSTAHVPQDFPQLSIPFRRVDQEYGWLVYLPGELEDEKRNKMIEDGLEFLVKIYDYAVKNDCTLLNFDADADQIEGLVEYHW